MIYILSMINYLNHVFEIVHVPGADPGFFLGHVRGGAHPLHPPPRSAPAYKKEVATQRDCLEERFSFASEWFLMDIGSVVTCLDVSRQSIVSRNIRFPPKTYWQWKIESKRIEKQSTLREIKLNKLLNNNKFPLWKINCHRSYDFKLLRSGP